MIQEDDYPVVINDLIRYIEYVKGREPDLSLLDIIMDYGFKKSMDLRLLGEIISTDVYFKSFIEKDCELHDLIDSETNNTDW